jgi:hypothetical protein
MDKRGGIPPTHAHRESDYLPGLCFALSVCARTLHISGVPPGRGVLPDSGQLCVLVAFCLPGTCRSHRTIYTIHLKFPDSHIHTDISAVCTNEQAVGGVVVLFLPLRVYRHCQRLAPLVVFLEEAMEPKKGGRPLGRRTVPLPASS